MKPSTFFLPLAFWTAFGFVARAQEASTKKEQVPASIEVEEVVTASKKPEKRLEAPSTIEIVDEKAILHSASTTFSGALSQVKGIDFANGGINLQKISTRGFSSSFNSRMLSLVDGRLSTLPGAGLPQGGLSPVSTLDIKTMEVVLGPAGALYGPNTTAGVLNIITKDPWDEAGYSASIKGGQQNLINAKIRFAEAYGNGWGWKLTGEYLDADEFDSDNVFDVNGLNQTAYPSDAAVQQAIDAGTAYRERDLVEDFTTLSEKFELSGYKKVAGDSVTLTGSYGWSRNDGFGVTNVGRNRIEDWEIKQYQFKANAARWYFQYSRTEEDAGNTYSIQNVPGLLAAGLSFQQAKAGALFIDKSTLDDLELQANQNFGDLSLIGGVNYRKFEPSSEGSYLDDFTDANGHVNDISRDELGLYLQAEYRAMEDRLRLVFAGRYDDFSEFDSQFSPKFGVTYQAGRHYLRANYITSYRAPEIIETHLFFFGGIARGNLDGFSLIDGAGNTVGSFDPLDIEKVKTLELGYRGIFGNSVLLDAVVYRSDYDNFISPLQTIASPAFGTAAVSSNGDVIPFLLTYLNYGAAKLDGFDLGLDFYFGDKVTLKTSVGYEDLKSFDNDSSIPNLLATETTIPDIPFNSPKLKYKAYLDLNNVAVQNSFFSIGGRQVDAYDYLSGRWAGRIESSFIGDLAVGYNLPDQDMVFKLSWSNITDQNKTELLGTPAVPSFVTFEIYKKF